MAIAAIFYLLWAQLTGQEKLTFQADKGAEGGIGRGDETVGAAVDDSGVHEDEALHRSLAWFGALMLDYDLEDNDNKDEIINRPAVLGAEVDV